MMIEMYVMLKSLNNTNPYEIFNKYMNFFQENKRLIECIKIRKGRVFYRGRKGNCSIPGSIDDLDIDVKLPHFNEGLMAPPPLYTSGGRFNRQGCSFLYLASDIKTCVAEIKLEVNQICSVGKFKCIQGGEYVNLLNCNNDFMKSLSR